MSFIADVILRVISREFLENKKRNIPASPQQRIEHFFFPLALQKECFHLRQNRKKFQLTFQTNIYILQIDR